MSKAGPALRHRPWFDAPPPADLATKLAARPALPCGSREGTRPARSPRLRGFRGVPLAAVAAVGVACGGKTEQRCDADACDSPRPAPGCYVFTSGDIPASPSSSPQATLSLSGPSVAATDELFVLGYRFRSGDLLGVDLFALSDSGTMKAVDTLDLDGCAQAPPSDDGTGIAYGGGSGLFVASLPDCGQGPGALFAEFLSNGSVNQVAASRNEFFSSLTLARSGSVAPASSPGEFEFIYRAEAVDDGPRVERVILQGTQFKTSVPAELPFGEGPLDYGMVATSPGLRAFAGVLQGKDLSLHVGPASTDQIQSQLAQTLPSAPFAALAAHPTGRVAIALPATTGVGWLEVQGYAPGPVKSGTVATDTPKSLALTAMGSGWALAAGVPGRVDLRVLSASTWLPVASLTLDATTHGSLATFDGSHLALAAARGMLVLVWLSRHELAPGEPWGGWALASCPPP